MNRSADLEELRKLGALIDNVTDLNDLKPIFFRIEELAKQYPKDVELAARIAAAKAHLVQHGQRLINLQHSPSGTSQSRSMTQAVADRPPARIATAEMPPPPPPSQVPQPRTGQIKPPPGAFNLKRAVIVGATAGALVFSGIVYTVRYSRTEQKSMTPGSVSMEVRTNPPGASIRIDNQEKCKSNCKLELVPGSYQIQAALLGYETATLSVSAVQHAMPLNITLRPVPPVVRLFTDLTAGKVVLDDQPAVDLQEGQLVLDRVTPGKHKLRISSPVGETEFFFEMNSGAMPEITGPVKASNMLAIIVSNFTTRAKVFASTNLKVSVDGVPNGEVGQQGLELKSLNAGDRELTLGEGAEQQKVLIGLGAQPAVTAFLKLNLNAGTVVVTTGEDDVKVLINDRDSKRLTKRGQLRLAGMAVGSYTIKVVKDGFNPETPQKVEVKRNEESRVEFQMRAIPKLAALRMRGAIPGAAILLDKDVLGAVQSDGTFSHTNIQPGEHTVEIRRERFAPKRMTRIFKAGEAVELTGADVILERATGTIRVNLTPPDARLSIKRSDEQQGRGAQGSSLSVGEGTYTLTARANGYVEKSISVQIVGGEIKSVDLTLAKEREAVQAQTPQAKPGTIADFENAAEWYTEGEYSLHKGGNFVLYGRTPVKGTLAFRLALLNGKRLQWFFNYTDSKNYVLFQMDKKNFFRREVANGNSQEFKVPHDLEKQNSYQFRIEVNQNLIVHSLYDGASWRVIDSFHAEGRNISAGKFGLLIPGKDVFGISNFHYQPK